MVLSWLVLLQGSAGIAGYDGKPSIAAFKNYVQDEVLKLESNDK